MAINTLSIDQASTILNAAVAQAKGGAVASLATKDFVTVAKTGLETGYDPLMTAINQVLSRSIFSNRPYSRKLKVLEADAIRYGNHVRKLNMVDGQLENDDRINLTDGVGMDQYVVSKPKVLQTNFYGSQTWQKHVTIYRDQLDVSLSGPEEFSRFISMVMTNLNKSLTNIRLVGDFCDLFRGKNRFCGMKIKGFVAKCTICGKNICRKNQEKLPPKGEKRWVLLR